MADQSLSYLVSRLVDHVFGSGITSIRYVSVLAGVLTVPIVFCIGRRLVSTRVGIYPCVLSAISLPMVVWQQNCPVVRVREGIGCRKLLDVSGAA